MSQKLNASDQVQTSLTHENNDYFERHIRPLLLEKCAECHGPETQWNGLRVDTRSALLRGGESGPAIVPGKAAASLLIEAVQRTGPIKMPPDDPLNREQIDRLIHWIDAGATWPTEATDKDHDQAARETHWAFLPIVDPELPENRWTQWVRNEIDLFVAEKLEKANLVPAGEADAQVLLRRITYDVTGLPPSAEQLADQFNEDPVKQLSVTDDLVDRLLTSPDYGEHWGRLWLDVARYSDTKGYVYAREEKNFIHSRVYRDWVINAFRRDLPYDRFLRLQLAADVCTDAANPDRAAMGFLTLGRRFIGVSHDIIDDRIDVVTRGLMGLTVACARCHDHKYDPIPTADYYSLYGIFLNSTERLERLGDKRSDIDSDWETELEKRERAFTQALEQARKAASDRMRSKIVDYFVAQTELEKYPQEGFDQILSSEDLIPNLVRRLDAALLNAKHNQDVRFTVWHRYAEIAGPNFEQIAVDVWNELKSAARQSCHPLTTSLFAQPPNTFQDVARAYANLIMGDGKEVFDDFLEGPDSPFEIPDELMYGIEGLFDSNTCNALWKLQNEIDRWILREDATSQFAVTLADREGEYLAQVLYRGNPARRGEIVPRRMLSVLTEDELRFSDGQDRLQLANQIASPANPLTARVWVNRIWKEYFGEGLVRTTSDFGLRAEPPSHPELLDWLSSRLIENHWGTKAIHRLILNSATYRQASLGSLPAEVSEQALRIDPANRLLWHQPAKRLSFEAMRDSLLAASDDLVRTSGGRSGELFPAEEKLGRRAIYCSIDRQFVPSVLRVFDFANPDMHSPKRNETLIAQQSLFSLNHPFMAMRARRLVESLSEGSDSERLEEMFRRALQRRPHAEELSAMRAFLADSDEEPQEAIDESALAWSYGTAKLIFEQEEGDESNAEMTVATVKDFVPLPHFSGTAWQGSSQYPDQQTGWAQLTAHGGHPGNDLDHAVVRRWTSPRDMSIRIHSTLNHEETAGDGVRGWIISSRQGVLATGRAHNSQWDWTGERFMIEKGEHIDLVVDIYKILNTDQFLWRVDIDEIEAKQRTDSWDTQKDFHGPATSKLRPWEQLAQVLLICNEAVFVE